MKFWPCKLQHYQIHNQERILWGRDVFYLALRMEELSGILFEIANWIRKKFSLGCVFDILNICKQYPATCHIAILIFCPTLFNPLLHPLSLSLTLALPLSHPTSSSHRLHHCHPFIIMLRFRPTWSPFTILILTMFRFNTTVQATSWSPFGRFLWMVFAVPIYGIDTP